VAAAAIDKVLRSRCVLGDHGPLVTIRLVAPHAGFVPVQQIRQHRAVRDIGRGGRFAHPSMSESLFGVHRPITVTARLYLGGAYLRRVSEQAIIEGGRRDPDLSAVIVRLTQDLLARGVDNSIDSLPLSVSR